MGESLHEVSGKSSIRCYKTDQTQNVKQILKIKILYSGLSIEKAVLSQQTNCCQVAAQWKNWSLGYEVAKPELSAFTVWVWFESCPCRNGLVVLLTSIPGGHSL